MSVILLGNLGTSDYKEVIYKYKNIEIKNKFATVAVLDLIYELNKEDNESYPLPENVTIFTTEEAEEKNYTDFKNAKSKSHNCNISNIRISSQENQYEIIKNFETFLKSINESDTLYIDISNSFRSVPLILLSAIERAKATKNIDVKGIFYGTFNKKDDNGKVIPEQIIDLLAFQNFNEWSYNIRQFTNNGYFNPIDSLSFLPMLNFKLSDDMLEIFNDIEDLETYLTKFSNSIYQPNRFTAIEYALKIKQLLSKQTISTVLQSEELQYTQFRDLIPLVKNIFDDFSFIGTSKSFIYNISLITELCFDFHLTQSALTFLQENLKAIILETNDDISHGHFLTVEKKFKEVQPIEHKILDNLKSNVTIHSLNYDSVKNIQ